MNDVEFQHNMTPNMLKGVNEITSILLHRSELYEDIAAEKLSRFGTTSGIFEELSQTSENI